MLQNQRNDIAVDLLFLFFLLVVVLVNFDFSTAWFPSNLWVIVAISILRWKIWFLFPTGGFNFSDFNRFNLKQRIFGSHFKKGILASTTASATAAKTSLWKWIVNSLRLRLRVRRELISVHYYCSCWLIVRCFVWLCLQYFWMQLLF